MYKVTEFTEIIIFAFIFQGLIYACVQCKYPAEELSKVWSHIGLHCPLMLVSTAVLPAKNDTSILDFLYR